MASVTYGNGTSQTYQWDLASRLTGLRIDLAGTAADLVIGRVGSTGTALAYNPASQLTSVTRSNPAYAYGGRYNVGRPYTVNGRNQYATAGSVTFGSDGRGNLTASGLDTFTYTSENRLAVVQPSGQGSAALLYDATGRLYRQTIGASITSFEWVGGALVSELATNGGIAERYVPGPDGLTPVVWYRGNGTGDRRWLHADERGSTVAVSDASGQALAINSHDEYGIPAASNLGRVQYTGHLWMPEIGLTYARARMYSPTLGRFMQTDPIGYADGLNWYAYAGNDPVNGRDPSGMMNICGNIGAGNGILSECTDSYNNYEIVVIGNRYPSWGELGHYTSIASVPSGFYTALSQVGTHALAFPQAEPQKEKPRVCFGPPQGPSGVSAGDLARQTRSNGDLAAERSATDLKWFYNQVRNKGPWDYKQYDRAYQAYGNYNFGYAGTRQGIPAPVLRAGAGYAQVRAGTSDWSFAPTAFDDPHDREQIDRGIHDALNGCF